MILLIDNYDSFTYNLFHYLGELGADVKVYLNDKITLEEIESLKPEKIVISPDRARQKKRGSRATRSDLRRQDSDPRRMSRPPVHRCGLGGEIVRAPSIMHASCRSFPRFENPLSVARQPFPPCANIAGDRSCDLSSDLIVSAKTSDGVIMACATSLPIEGAVHPESF